MPVGRWIGIDYGLQRVGIAVSDPLGMIAKGHSTLPARSEKKLIEALCKLLKDLDAVGFVIGLPIKTNGEAGSLTEVIYTLADKLKLKTNVPVVFEDERFTSTIAQQSLQAQGISPSRNKGLIDQTAAALILQGFLDKQSRLT